jgi:hypothetical protein
MGLQTKRSNIGGTMRETCVYSTMVRVGKLIYFVDVIEGKGGYQIQIRQRDISASRNGQLSQWFQSITVGNLAVDQFRQAICEAAAYVANAPTT